MQQPVLCQLSLLFPLGSLRTPLNWSKLVRNLLLLFSKVYCFDFYIPRQSSSHIYLVDHMLCQPHLYLPPPLSRLCKLIECSGRFGEPQLHRWTPEFCNPRRTAPATTLLLKKLKQIMTKLRIQCFRLPILNLLVC